METKDRFQPISPHVVIMWVPYEGWWAWLFKWHVAAVIYRDEIAVYAESYTMGIRTCVVDPGVEYRLPTQLAAALPLKEDMVSYHLMEPFTCVNFVKRLIGINSIFVQTPKGLLRRIRKDGWSVKEFQ